MHIGQSPVVEVQKLLQIYEFQHAECRLYATHVYFSLPYDPRGRVRLLSRSDRYAQERQHIPLRRGQQIARNEADCLDFSMCRRVFSDCIRDRLDLLKRFKKSLRKQTRAGTSFPVSGSRG